MVNLRRPPSEEAHAVGDLVHRERHWRDRGDWDRMATAYAPESTVALAWFNGSGADFVAASRAGGRGGVTKHRLSPSIVDVHGDRALAETSATIETRLEQEGVEIDLVSSCRYLERLVRSRDGWRILRVDCICERDAVRAVRPEDIVQIDPQLLRGFRQSYRFVSYSLSAAGLPVRMDLPGDDLPQTTSALYRNAEKWLSGKSSESTQSTFEPPSNRNGNDERE